MGGVYLHAIKAHRFSRQFRLAKMTNETANLIVRRGARHVCVSNGELAIQEMKRVREHHKFQFPLVVIDHQMPEMSGLDLVAKVRDIPELTGTAFIIVSTINADQIASDYRHYGVLDIIEKPYPTHRLTDIILKYLAEENLRNLKEVLSDQSGRTNSDHRIAEHTDLKTVSAV